MEKDKEVISMIKKLRTISPAYDINYETETITFYSQDCQATVTLVDVLCAYREIKNKAIVIKGFLQ
jgi:hypothetical protein